MMWCEIVIVNDNKFCILLPRPKGGGAKLSKIFLAFTIAYAEATNGVSDKFERSLVAFELITM